MAVYKLKPLQKSGQKRSSPRDGDREKMIKRRFYKFGQSAHDGSSSSSSSESDSDEEVEELAEKEVSESDDSSGSGYESEDSSRNEIIIDSSDLPDNDNNNDTGKTKGSLRTRQQVDEDLPGDLTRNGTSKDNHEADDLNGIEMDYTVLKHKSVFKCRICPRIICLSESTLLAHLQSKRHARSKKLLGEGRLKLMLNSDGEIEEDQETHAERHARTVALAKDSEGALKKKKRGRQRQRERRKLKLSSVDERDKTKALVKKEDRRNFHKKV
ncbi:stress response protein [Wolffia australiana]